MGSTTTQDRSGTCAIAPNHIAFRFDDRVGALIGIFRSSIPSPSIPLSMLRRAPRGARCKTRGRVVRYSFLVRLLQPLLQAGLSRRSVNYSFGLTTTVSPDGVDSSFLLPSAARCLIKNVTRPKERDEWQIE